MSASPSHCPKFVAPTPAASVFQAGKRDGEGEILYSREPSTLACFPGKKQPKALTCLVSFSGKRGGKKDTVNFFIALFCLSSLLAHQRFWWGRREIQLATKEACMIYGGCSVETGGQGSKHFPLYTPTCQILLKAMSGMQSDQGGE